VARRVGERPRRRSAGPRAMCRAVCIGATASGGECHRTQPRECRACGSALVGTERRAGCVGALGAMRGGGAQRVSSNRGNATLALASDVGPIGWLRRRQDWPARLPLCQSPTAAVVAIYQRCGRADLRPGSATAAAAGTAQWDARWRGNGGANEGWGGAARLRGGCATVWRVLGGAAALGVGSGAADRRAAQGPASLTRRSRGAAALAVAGPVVVTRPAAAGPGVGARRWRTRWIVAA